MKLAGVHLVLAVLAAGQFATPVEAARKPKQVAAPVPPPPSVKQGVELWRAGDYAGAVAMWQPFANGGDADAMFNIGQAYKLGRAVPKNAETARDWYRRAALKDHLPAQANLGILLFQAGEKPEALRWLKAAADKNEMRAQYVLGVANWNGDGLPRNMTLAYAYLARAAAQGLPEGKTALGNLTAAIAPVERANGWAVATSLAAGNGIPPEFGAPRQVDTAALDRFNREQVMKAAPAPQPASPPTPVAAPPVAPPPVAVAAAPPAAAPTPVPTPAPVIVAQRTPPPATTPVPATRLPPAQLPVSVAEARIAPPRPAPVPIPAPIAADIPAKAPSRPAAPPVETVAIPPSAPPMAAAIPPKPANPPVVVATATPKPVPKAAPKPTGWRVQLGAFSKRAQAEAAWTEVKTKQKQLVAKSQPIYTADGNVTKLQMGPFPNKAAARDACAKIAFAGRACFVTEG